MLAPVGREAFQRQRLGVSGCAELAAGEVGQRSSGGADDYRRAHFFLYFWWSRGGGARGTGRSACLSFRHALSRCGACVSGTVPPALSGYGLSGCHESAGLPASPHAGDEGQHSRDGGAGYSAGAQSGLRHTVRGVSPTALVRHCTPERGRAEMRRQGAGPLGVSVS
ncbi:hypothetical protein D3C78_886890 [compost metagenome]